MQKILSQRGGGRPLHNGSLRDGFLLPLLSRSGFIIIVSMLEKDQKVKIETRPFFTAEIIVFSSHFSKKIIHIAKTLRLVPTQLNFKLADKRLTDSGFAATKRPKCENPLLASLYGGDMHFLLTCLQKNKCCRPN